MLTAIAVLLLLSVAQATPSPSPGAGAQRARVPDPELIRMLDTYALVQAQEALRLDDEQYGQFVMRLKRLQETRRRHQQARNRLVQQLRKLAGIGRETAPLDEAAIGDGLKALREHDDRAAAEMRQAYDALDGVLSVAQQARFRVFEQMMERRKLDLLVRARERAARRR